MQPLGERQRDFATAILDPARAVPPGLVGPDGAPSARRFAVYRNNVVAGLIETLAAAFPAARRIVGDEFFRAMARLYVASAPPRSPIMLDYGAGFPDFIDRFEPAATLPYLADVARLERAWTEAYHAAEAPVLDPAIFARFAPDELPALRLRLHPSVRLVRSRFPAMTIWRMNVGDGVPAPVDLDAGGEDIMVARPDAEVEVRALPEGGAAFVSALDEGRTVLAATTAALAADRHFDLAAGLAGLLRARAIAGVLSLPEAGAEASRGGPRP